MRRSVKEYEGVRGSDRKCEGVRSNARQCEGVSVSSGVPEVIIGRHNLRRVSEAMCRDGMLVSGGRRKFREGGTFGRQACGINLIMSTGRQ